MPIIYLYFFTLTLIVPAASEKSFQSYWLPAGLNTGGTVIVKSVLKCDLATYYEVPLYFALYYLVWQTVCDVVSKFQRDSASCD